MAARDIVEGARVRVRGVRRDHPEYDEGTVLARDGDAVAVRWSVAGATYTEPLRELLPVRSSRAR